MSSLDRTRDAIDLVAASVGVSLRIIEHAIFGKYLVYRRAPTRGSFSPKTSRRLRMSKVDMQDGGTHGRVGQFEFYATNDLSNWGAALVQRAFGDDATEKRVSLVQNTYRYVRLRALTETGGGPWTSMAELNFFTSCLRPRR